MDKNAFTPAAESDVPIPIPNPIPVITRPSGMAKLPYPTDLSAMDFEELNERRAPLDEAVVTTPARSLALA